MKNVIRPDAPIFVAGHRGMVGSSIVRALERRGCRNLVLRTHRELDLLDQQQTRKFFAENRIEAVFLAAAKVGGIIANSTQQADFLCENLVIETNVIRAALDSGVEKLLFLGSACIYPRMAPQPIPESALLTGPLEPTNEGYALAKIAGMKLCEYIQRQHKRRFISAMPNNLYGINDNFHPQHSHVIPGMMRRFHEAKLAGAPEVVIWGTGRVLREFVEVDDLADALLLVMEKYEEPTTINIGSGEEHSIAEIAGIIQDVIGYPGRITFDTSKPDGMPRKLVDTSRIRALGWRPTLSLRDGLAKCYRWAVESGVLAGGRR
jgi:GDP-L-fucose synthase